MRRLARKKGYTLMLVVFITMAISILVLGLITISYHNTVTLSKLQLEDEVRIEIENQAYTYLYENAELQQAFAELQEGEGISGLDFGNGTLVVAITKENGMLKITQWQYKG